MGIVTKKRLVSFLTKEHNEIKHKAIQAACSALIYLKTHKTKNTIGAERRVCYLINNHLCICTTMDFRKGILEFTPFSTQADIGTGYKGGILRINFND